jgi:hypothetical protein
MVAKAAVAAKLNSPEAAFSVSEFEFACIVVSGVEEKK